MSFLLIKLKVPLTLVGLQLSYCTCDSTLEQCTLAMTPAGTLSCREEAQQDSSSSILSLMEELRVVHNWRPVLNETVERITASRRECLLLFFQTVFGVSLLRWRQQDDDKHLESRSHKLLPPHSTGSEKLVVILLRLPEGFFSRLFRYNFQKRPEQRSFPR